MIQAHELTTPIQYGYLFLSTAIILLACIAGIIYILREIRSTATDAPDYHAYWKSMATDNIPNNPIGQWMAAKQMDRLEGEVNQELSSIWEYLHNEKRYRLTIPSEGLEKGIQMDLSTDVEINVVWPFTWQIFLHQAVNSQCTQEQIDKAKILSISWKSCPCCELDRQIPRKESGEPKDKELARLGADFWWSMLMDDYLEATKIHHKIKTREATLLNLIKQAPKPKAKSQKPTAKSQSI